MKIMSVPNIYNTWCCLPWKRHNGHKHLRDCLQRLLLLVTLISSLVHSQVWFSFYLSSKLPLRFSSKLLATTEQSTPCAPFTPAMAGSLDLTDTDLSDLFDRYPDIKFDSTDDLIPGCDISEHFSSPCSNATNHDATPTSKRNAASTAHTTPLRPIEGCSEDSDLPTVDIFLEGLDKADLPLMSKEGFGRLAREMTILAASLVPVDGDYYGSYVDSNKTKIHYQAQSILEQLKQANDKVTDEIDNIQWVRTRAPFMVEPAMQDLWCNYRQRAKLIAQ